MKKLSNLLLPSLIMILLLSSCVAKKKYLDSQIALRYSKNDSAMLAAKIKNLDENVNQMQQQIADLNNKNSKLSNDNTQLANDALSKQNNLNSQLNKTQQAYSDQQKKLEQLQALLDQQKLKSQELKKKMSDALVGFNSNELTVSQKNGKVYVSLQESLLFPSGSAVVNVKGKEALKKLAEVLNVNPDIAVNIEGHTDSIPIRGKYEDNWALSTARATSIVRILVNDYKVDAVRVVASGHSQFDPVESNSTPDGRAKNRRTEIILSPKLDELYKLLEQ